MFSKSSPQPSAIYVFFVVSLAAFLTMFTLWRRPQAQYVVETSVAITAKTAKDSASPEQLLQPETVLASLQNAGMIQGNARGEMLEIAREITGRLRAEQTASEENVFVNLAIRTAHPAVGARLLNQMIADHLDTDSNATSSQSQPIVSRMHGISIHRSSLVLLLMCSALVGIGALALREQSKETSLLLTTQDVAATTQLPVVADFTKHVELPARTRKRAWNRRCWTTVRLAEFSVSAAMLLMVYNIVTHQTFSDLLVTDPLAAYSDAIGRLLG